MRSRPFALWSTASLIFVSVVLLRWFTADQLSFGPEDLDVYSARPYGVEVDRETPPFFLTWTRGDGQAFYSIASDLNGDGPASGLGNLSYRMSRIGMSVLARVLTLGNPEWLTYTLPLVSLLSYGALVAVSVRLFRRLGSRALLIPLTPAAFIGALYDTSETLGTLLLVASLTSTTLLGATFTAALLGVSRPSYAIGLPASRHGLIPAAFALGAGALLQVVLVAGLDIPFSGGAGNLGPPLVGFSEAWPTMTAAGRFVAVSVLGIAVALVILAFTGNHHLGFRVTAVLTAGFSLCLAAPVFLEAFSPLRATGPALILIILAPIFESAAAHGLGDDESSPGDMGTVAGEHRPTSTGIRDRDQP